MKINLNIFRKSIRKINVKEPLSKKGFIIFQIDGLSHKALKKALSLNLMPHLKKIIKEGGFSFGKYFTGVPSDTPFFQAGLLYGDNDNIPGFRWIEKETGNEIIFKKPESAGHIEELLSKKNNGLLKGGSSYVNLFAGGAYRSTFTLSTFSIRYLFKRKVRNLDIFVVFVFHIFTFSKTFFYVFFEFLIEIWEKIIDIVKKRDARPEGLFPFARVMSNVIFKEIETFGCIMDISRGVPAIYLDYIGYDELSHHRGPYSYSALRTLKAIDRKIYNIYKEIKKSEKHYDFFVISDHGHTPSTPFIKINNNKKLKDIIESYIKNEDMSIYEFDSGYNAAIKRLIIYMGDFFKKGTCSKIINKFSGKIYLIDKEIENEGNEKLNWERDKIIYIMNSGPMANLYFSGKLSKMSVEEIENIYPGLINMLSKTAGIGLVMGLSNKKEVLFYDVESNKFVPFLGFLKSDNYKSFQTFKNIIDEYKTEKEKKIVVLSIKNFCLFKNSGDLILFGEYGKNNIINFENQLGAHGGIGGDQNIPFAVWSNSIPFNFTEVNNSCKIYEFLYNNYVRQDGGNIS